MIQPFTVNTEYRGRTMYHSGLVYRPAERVLILPTMWIGTFPSPSTGKLYSKSIQAFLNHLSREIKAARQEDVDAIIINFEKHVRHHDIHVWMARRVAKRESANKDYPKNSTIEKEAHHVATYLTWVKEKFTVEGRGEEIPYDPAKKVKKVLWLKDSNLLRGIKNSREVEVLQSIFHTSYKPVEGTSKATMARKKQTMGHEYLREGELEVFVNSFADEMWKYFSLTSYHTGMRPFEIMALPRYEEYSNGKSFTADPEQIRRKIADGEETMEFFCVGKGRKERWVEFELEQWLAIMEGYERLFLERKLLYEAEVGEELPLHYLWLNKLGEVQYCQPMDELAWGDMSHLHGAVDRARKKHNLEERFGHSVDFYSIRHSFATDWVIDLINGDKDLKGKSADALIQDDILRRKLADQMGHTLERTTWMHYIHSAIGRTGLRLPKVTDILKVYL